MTPLPEPSYREIPLTKGQVARVSPERYEEVSAFNWYAYWSKRGRCFYAARNSPRIKGKRHCILMARYILGLDYGDPLEADHINRLDTLDNTDGNLRIVDRTRQNWNRGRQSNNICGFKGVSKDTKTGKYAARIKVDGEQRFLGLRDTPEEAAELYKAAAIANFKDHACFD